jgi:hypothetical protein
MIAVAARRSMSRQRSPLKSGARYDFDQLPQ